MIGSSWFIEKDLQSQVWVVRPVEGVFFVKECVAVILEVF